MYLLKLALRPWKSAFLSQILSASAVGVLLLLIGMLAWVQYSLGPVISRMKSEQVITAYLDPSLGPKEEQRVTDQIRISLGSAPVSDLRLVTSREFVESMKAPYPELARELDELGGETAAMIPRHVSVQGILAEDALDKIKAVRGVDMAESSKDRYTQIVSAFTTLRWIVTVLASALLFALLTGLVHLARMNAFFHKDALSILKLWGASSWETRVPSVLSSAIVGLMGGLMAATAWLLAGSGLVAQLKVLSPVFTHSGNPAIAISIALLIVGTTAGAASGLLGSSRTA